MALPSKRSILFGILLLASLGAGGWYYLYGDEELALPGAKTVASSEAPAKPPAQAPSPAQPPQSKPQLPAQAQSPTQAQAAAAPKPAPKPASADPDEIVKRVVEESGVRAFLAAQSEHARHSLQASAKGRKPETMKILEGMVDRIYEPQKLARELSAELKKKYDAEKMPRFLDALRQPVAAKLTAMEVQRVDADAVKKYFAATKKTPPSLARQQAIRKLDEASHASDFSAELSVAMTQGVSQAVEAAARQSAGKPPAKGGGNRPTKARQDELAAQFRTAMHYIYRDASDAELGEYVKLLTSDTGKWGTTTLHDAMRAVLAARAEELGSAVTDLAAVKAGGDAKPAIAVKPAAEASPPAAVKPADTDKASAAITAKAPAAPAAGATASTENKPAAQTPAAAKTAALEDDEAEEGADKPAAGEAKAAKAKPKAAPPREPLVEDTIAYKAPDESDAALNIVVRRPDAPPLYSRHNDVLTATVLKDHSAIQELLDAGKNPNMRQKNGYTPLMVSAALGDIGAVRLLLNRGADPNLKADGVTALSLARARGKADIAALLESFGAKP